MIPLFAMVIFGLATIAARGGMAEAAAQNPSSVSVPASKSSGANEVRGTTTSVAARGRVVVLVGVRLVLRGTPPSQFFASAVSDSDGRFRFDDVPAGAYTLEAAAPGFASAVESLSVSSGQVIVKDFRLSLQEVHQQVEVRERAPVVTQQSAAPPATLSAPRLAAAPTPEQKFKQALPLMPSVVRSQQGTLYIRGSTENQGMLLVDSMEAVDPVGGRFVTDVPIDAIESLDVFKAPFNAQYGGFVGGLTRVNTQPPSSQWRYKMDALNPSIRGKQGHMVGFSKAEPRLYFSGPLGSKSLNFSEAFAYQIDKVDVRGLAWPHDETKTQGFNSFSTLQWLASERHVLTVNFNVFPRRQQFADLNALIPQQAASDDGQRGYLLATADHYQFSSGIVMSTEFDYLRVSNYSHGEGGEDLLVTPRGWEGNFFNQWARTSNQEQGGTVLTLPAKKFLGQHTLKFGGDTIHRSFGGTTESHPVELLRADGTVAEEIEFRPNGALAGSDTEGLAFLQDHWVLNSRLALDPGFQWFGQSVGEKADPAPRMGLVFSPDRARTVFRAGIGIFYDHTSLLAEDFTGNPARVAQFFTVAGFPTGSAVTLNNVCAERSAGGPRALSSCSDFDSTPYDITWQANLTREVGKNVTVRLGFLMSKTYNLFVVDPLFAPSGGAQLTLWNRGLARYHEYEAEVRYQPNERSELTVTYVHSRSRGDLNSVGQIFVPFEQPVIRPDFYANLPSDVPDRLTALGLFKLPKAVTFSPALDFHSGFPYSNVDVFQNYVGTPESLRYPIYFSFSFRVYRDFPIPFVHKGHKFRFGVYSINLTGRQNPNAVYNNIASPYFGTFTGLDKRVNGIVIGFAE